jgi:WD40 repeat protein
MFALDRTSVGSFTQRDTSSSESGDTGEYVFEVETTLDGSMLLSSMSDHTLTLTNSTDMRTHAKIKAHKATINRIETSKVNPNLLFSCSDDKKTFGWDARCFDKPVLQISHQEEVTALSVGVNGTLMSTACGSSIYFFDIRAFSGASAATVHANKLGVYADVHSDMITQLKFHPNSNHILTSAAEDGLLCLYDTSVQAEEDAIISVLNTECPVAKFGYFGVENEGIYSISTVETLSFWHYPSAQRVAQFSNIRENLRADYLVDCFCAPNTNDVCLLAGDYSGQGVVAQIQPDRYDVLGYLQGGHTANIRCCNAAFASASVGAASGVRLITGGEDARLCSWRTQAQGQAASAGAGTAAAVHSPAQAGFVPHRSSGVTGGGSAGGAVAGHIKAKKDSSKMRYKPY